MTEKKNSQVKAHAPVAPAVPVVERPAEVTGTVAQNAPQQPTVTGINHDKSYVKAMVLTTMFGWFGVDRFYLGKVGTGVLKLVTFGGFGIWYLVDFIITLVGGAREKGKDNQELDDTAKYKPFFVRLTLIWVGVYIAIIVLEMLLLFIWLPKIMQELTPPGNRYELVCFDHWNQNYLPPETCPDYMPGDYSDPGVTNIYREN